MTSWRMLEPMRRRGVGHFGRAGVVAPFSNTCHLTETNSAVFVGGSSASSGRKQFHSTVWTSDSQMGRTGRSCFVAHRPDGSRRCTGTSPAAGKEEDIAAGTSSLPRNLGLAAAATAVAGGIAYFAYPQGDDTAGDVETPKFKYDLKPMVEETFEWADNLFVFMLDSEAELKNRRQEIEHVIGKLVAENSLHRCTYFYNAKKEDQQNLPETPLPTAGGDESGKDAAPVAVAPTLRVAMYKGQRKNMTRLSTDMPQEHVDEVVGFFNPVSEDLKDSLRKVEVGRVSGVTFVTDVLDASSSDDYILLQMYEDTCFLCFLMRPFINSLAVLLRETGIPVRIKRLNLERNDFPDGCPVARGTPTFVMFRGSANPPTKWDEFKPKDVVDKLKADFPNIPDAVFEQMDEMQNKVSNRLQLFTQSVMWIVEMQKLERLIGTGAPSQAEAGSEADHPTEDAAFGTVVHEMMMKDMKRHDGLHSNLEHLRKEVEEFEHDASLMGAMLAQSVFDREQAEGLIQYS